MRQSRLLSPSLSSILNGGEGARRAGEEALRLKVRRNALLAAGNATDCDGRGFPVIPRSAFRLPRFSL